jgi:hypothetical protein
VIHALYANKSRPDREVIDFAKLMDEPFLALPADAGPLRDYARACRQARR